MTPLLKRDEKKLEIKNDKKYFNFKLLDRTIRISKKDERYEHAFQAGYDYISEHTIKEYRRTQSLSKTAKSCGVSVTAITRILNEVEEPIRDRGGCVYTKLSKDDVKEIRKFKKGVCNNVFLMLAEKYSRVLSERYGEEITISVSAIRNIIIRESHKSHKAIKKEKGKNETV